MLTLKVTRLDPSVPLPSYGHEGDVGMDLCARETVTLVPGARAQVPTGIALQIPDGFGGFIWDKSGLSHLHGLKTLGGVIDAGYRGEIKVGVVNLGSVPYTIERHHKVAQLVVQRVERVACVEVHELDRTTRGVRGFGSTGR